jgi:Ni/Fe-hydrogenase subunit HybB-like protein
VYPGDCGSQSTFPSIALGAGAFSLCAGVYLFGLKRFQPIARTATFVGLIGYTMATLALILDIGKPERFWHSMVYWNVHSLLWEVTMCVILYLTVLLLEAMPIIANLEWLRKRFPKIAKLMSSVHHYAPFLCDHRPRDSPACIQSSLGATYGIIKGATVLVQT